MLESTPQGSKDKGFNQLNSAFASVFNVLHDTDMPPTEQAMSAAIEARYNLSFALAAWADLKKELPPLNTLLKKAGQKEIVL